MFYEAYLHAGWKNDNPNTPQGLFLYEIFKVLVVARRIGRYGVTIVTEIFMPHTEALNLLGKRETLSCPADSE